MRINSFNFVLLILISISLILRVQRFDYPISYTFAWGDGTRDYLLASHIISHKEFPLVGPYNLLYESGIRNSAIYFYLLAFPLLLFNNVLTLSAINIILQLFLIVLIYLISRKVFDEKVALVSIAFFSFNPEVIKQSDFIWQPYLMYPIAYFALLVFIMGYFRKNYKLFLVSFVLISIAIAIHNSAFPWLPLFLIISFYFLKKERKSLIFYLMMISTILLSLTLLYLPHSLNFLKSPPPNISSFLSNSFLTNLNLNIKQFMDAFYINSQVFLLIFALISFNIIRNRRDFKIFIITLLFFLFPIIFASIFNKIRLHYLILSFGAFTIMVAASLRSLAKLPKVVLIFFLIITFSGNFSFIKDFKKPLQNQQLIDDVTNVILTELRDIKRKDGFLEMDFFQIKSYGSSTENPFEYPVLDTILLVPLEKKLNRKLVEVSDQSPYNHIQINRKNYLLVTCFKSSYNYSNCDDQFKRSYPYYHIMKTIYQGDLLIVYLAKYNG